MRSLGFQVFLFCVTYTSEGKLLTVFNSLRTTLSLTSAFVYGAAGRKTQELLWFQKKPQTHGEHYYWYLFKFHSKFSPILSWRMLSNLTVT